MQRVVDNLAVAGGKDRPTVNIMPSTIIAISGIAKVFVGELIEEGIQCPLYLFYLISNIFV